MSLYGVLLRRALLPAYYRLRNHDELRHLARLEETQWLPPDELRKRQWQRLERLLRFAHDEIPYYRDRLREAGLRPDRIDGPESFAKIPLLTRRGIQERGAELQGPDWATRSVVHDGTGGSTGEPVRFFFSKASYDRRAAATARTDRWAGWDYGERTAWLWGTDRDLIPEGRWQAIRTSLYWTMRREKWFSAFAPEDNVLMATVRAVEQFRPSVIFAFPTRAYEVARYLIDRDLPHRIRPRGIVTSGEALESHQREVTEKAFACRVFNRYGCREFSLIAAECPRHEGLHVNSDNVYVEFLRDGRPARPGETANLVITDLTNYAMPLIRYAIGDSGRSLQSRCSCGRGLPLMEVEGRVCDTVVAPNGRLLSGIFFGHLLKYVAGIRRFQAIQRDMNHLEVRVIPGENRGEHDLDWALQRIRDAVGPEVDVAIRHVDDIPLTRSGKHRLVISQVATGASAGHPAGGM
jgi:phenylacetate-CoA ligase